jgi:alpha-galactosidase
LNGTSWKPRLTGRRCAAFIRKQLCHRMQIVRNFFFLGAILISLASVSIAQLATTPPMGWNSWDSYGLTITESEFKQNVDWFNAHLKSSGWRYVVIDEGWYLAHPDQADQGYTLDANGRYIPAVDRFPSADQDRGFRLLVAYVHSLGLKFGIHIIRGIPRQAVERNLPIAGSSYHAADAADTSDTCRWNHDNYGVSISSKWTASHSLTKKPKFTW